MIFWRKRRKIWCLSYYQCSFVFVVHRQDLARKRSLNSLYTLLRYHFVKWFLAVHGSVFGRHIHCLREQQIIWRGRGFISKTAACQAANYDSFWCTPAAQMVIVIVIFHCSLGGICSQLTDLQSPDLDRMTLCFDNSSGFKEVTEGRKQSRQDCGRERIAFQWLRAPTGVLSVWSVCVGHTDDGRVIFHQCWDRMGTNLNHLGADQMRTWSCRSEQSVLAFEVFQRAAVGANGQESFWSCFQTWHRFFTHIGVRQYVPHIVGQGICCKCYCREPRLLG